MSRAARNTSAPSSSITQPRRCAKFRLCSRLCWTSSALCRYHPPNVSRVYNIREFHCLRDRLTACDSQERPLRVLSNAFGGTGLANTWDTVQKDNDPLSFAAYKVFAKIAFASTDRISSRFRTRRVSAHEALYESFIVFIQDQVVERLMVLLKWSDVVKVKLDFVSTALSSAPDGIGVHTPFAVAKHEAQALRDRSSRRFSVKASPTRVRCSKSDLFSLMNTFM